MKTTGQYINHRCQYGIYCPVSAFDTPTHHYTNIYIYIYKGTYQVC